MAFFKKANLIDIATRAIGKEFFFFETILDEKKKNKSKNDVQVSLFIVYRL